ncbi:MAG: uroporphyrinogen-III synthase [Archangium sp.]|nr:uroporphyrinogen-III synthase [Archangium sp.]
MAKWILTREGDDGGDVEALLRERGHQVVRVPCIETQWHAWPWPADPHALTIFTSRRAVECFARSVATIESSRAKNSGAAPHPDPLPQGREGSQSGLGVIAALRPETSRALAELGLEPDIEATGGSRALAHGIVTAWPWLSPRPMCIRYPTSSAGLSAPEQDDAVRDLSALGRVERTVVYDVTAPALLARELAAALIEPSWSIVFASPSAVSHFFTATGASASAPAHAVCFGASTARAWNERRPEAWPAASATSDLRSTLEVIT